ncbi:hypothetical protein H6G20_07755 [Desertifilum sp. FACHB-1129]|uniref:Uncharacterized protein n=2 Tax=Cyanophyceae TaxID=3028117 RepID=A0A1E5QIS8_9CYAN|nr:MULTISPECIES: HHL1-like protein [Cyanophyceae]MCD8488858.1 DUF6523 family protein [Desertifilum sp.]MDA0210551.1 DUF6523 family protein [Cyanobacteria bacterium FC1]MDL5047884.1 DUF6523 family protein [Oscillatoria amoena NRMC-F 0135]MBD2311551.1 hypothetical protein [Desertifilum sp. FACHB-1129]MBD2323125.1 hypothetical protein [Desertifilum sp. FACHB-866]
MPAKTGFGKPQPQKNSSNTARRVKAEKQYEKMSSKGMPEFAIFARIKDKKNWYPVGSLTVNRSNQINQAIFANLEDLRQGAFRLYPILRKNQQNLEYGYKLKGEEFADEPIQLAVPPQPGAGNLIQNTVANVTNAVSGLFKRK